MPAVKGIAWLNQVHRAIAGGKNIQQLGGILKKERVSPRQLLETCQQIDTPEAWQIRRALMLGINKGTLDVNQIDSQIITDLKAEVGNLVQQVDTLTTQWGQLCEKLRCSPEQVPEEVIVEAETIMKDLHDANRLKSNLEDEIKTLTQGRDAARQQSAQTSRQARVEHQRLETENKQLRAQVAQLSAERIKPTQTQESQPVAADVPAEEAVKELVGLLYRASNYAGTPEQVRGRLLQSFEKVLEDSPVLLSALEKVVSSKRQESLGPLINNLLEFPENEGLRQGQARENIINNLADIDPEFHLPDEFLFPPKTGLSPRHLGRYWLVELWKSLVEANHPSLGDFEKVAVKRILHKNIPDHALFRGDKLGLEQRTQLYCELLFALNLDLIPGSLHRLMFTPGAISLFLPQISRQKIQETYNKYNKIREEADRLLSSGVGSGNDEAGIKIFLVSSLLIILYGIGIEEDRGAARAALKVWEMHYPKKIAPNISDKISQGLSELRKIANQPLPDQATKIDAAAQQAQPPGQLDFMGLVRQLFEEGLINQQGLDQLQNALQSAVSLSGKRRTEIENIFNNAARLDTLTSDQGKDVLGQIGNVLEMVGLSGNASAAGIADQIEEFLAGGQ
jgi:hypothetical protein